MSSTLSDRYRTAKSLPTRLMLGLGGLIIAVLIAWLCWEIFVFHGHYKVVSDAGVNQALGENRYQIHADITLGKGVAASSVRCQASVLAYDGTTVGGPYLLVPKHGGANVFVVRTTRRGFQLDWEGCRAPGQDDLR